MFMCVYMYLVCFFKSLSWVRGAYTDIHGLLCVNYMHNDLADLGLLLNA